MSRAQDLFDRLVAGGEAEVLSFIAQPVTEELFLDYKRSADGGAGTSLDNRDRSNLGKAISGFGNSEGGVIVWGVDCRNDPARGDIPTAPVRIVNPVRFKSWLEQATTGLTVPPHVGVRHHEIPEGFVVTLIPGGIHAPYQTVGDLSYYIRSGSNFNKIPHAVLSGMFGRRPQPNIKHHYFIPRRPNIVSPGIVGTEMGVMLRNYGRGIGEDVFLNLSVTSHPGRNCNVLFSQSNNREVWSSNLILNRQIQMITRREVRLPPEADLMPVTLNIELQNPIDNDFAFEGMCGSAGGEPSKFEFRCGIADIIEAFDRLSKTPQAAPDFAFVAQRFNRIFRAYPVNADTHYM
jgi:hypothetical protein